MDVRNLQTPEEMLERWQGAECQCDPSVGHLCECCHDIQVMRDLIKDRDRMVDMLEFFLGQMQLTDCKMDGQHGWRFRHGWPMTHCIGPSAEEAAKAAIKEVKRSRAET